MNSPDHVPPTPVSTSKGHQRWLAIIEGLAFSWLLLIGYLVVYKMERVKICLLNHDGFPEEQARALTIMLNSELSSFIIYLHPESDWSTFGGIGLAGIGFGLLSSRAPEALHSRIFRWTCIGLATVLFALFNPWISMHTCMCGGLEDETWLDEVLFVIPGALLLLIALRRIWKTRHVSVL